LANGRLKDNNNNVKEDKEERSTLEPNETNYRLEQQNELTVLDCRHGM